MISIKINKDSFFVMKKKYDTPADTFAERILQARCLLILFHGLTKSDLDKIKFIDNTIKVTKKPIKISVTKEKRQYNKHQTKQPKIERQTIEYDKKYRYITVRKRENLFVVKTKNCPYASKKIETTTQTLEKALEMRNDALSNNPEFLQAVIDSDNNNNKKYYKFILSNNKQNLSTGEKYIVIRNDKFVVRYNKSQKTFNSLEEAKNYRDSII